MLRTVAGKAILGASKLPSAAKRAASISKYLAQKMPRSIGSKAHKIDDALKTSFTKGAEAGRFGSTVLPGTATSFRNLATKARVLADDGAVAARSATLAPLSSSGKTVFQGISSVTNNLIKIAGAGAVIVFLAHLMMGSGSPEEVAKGICREKLERDANDTCDKEELIKLLENWEDLEPEEREVLLTQLLAELEEDGHDSEDLLTLLEIYGITMDELEKEGVLPEDVEKELEEELEEAKKSWWQRNSWWIITLIVVIILLVVMGVIIMMVKKRQAKSSYEMMGFGYNPNKLLDQVVHLLTGQRISYY